MLAWFGNPHDFDKLGTVEANFILFRQSLITRLIMKAWLTCALDASCIAPLGSSIHGPWRLHKLGYESCLKTCLCHRFDQAALGAILTFFYGHPEDRVDHLPAFAIRSSEEWFHIKRHAFSMWDDIYKLFGLVWIKGVAFGKSRIISYVLKAFILNFTQ